MTFRDCRTTPKNSETSKSPSFLTLTKTQHTRIQKIEIHTMKLNNTHNMKRKSGMTLLELTVVILVLLSLISILFVGARAWKKGSDRSANIMNLRNCQQAMRGEENMKTLDKGAAFTKTQLEAYIKYPSDIGTAVTYTEGTVITEDSASPVALDIAHLWLQPSPSGEPGAEYGHAALADVTGW